MAVIRGHHSFDDHFTQIPNQWLRDARLSFKARGLLSLILSHSAGWSLSINSLAKQNQEGKDSIRKAIKELETFGYLKRSQVNVGGRFGESIWTTTDPSEIPLAEIPLAEKQSSENPTPKNNNYLEKQSKEITTRATRLSDDFQVTDEMRAWASEKHPGVDIEKATANFFDYWQTKATNATKLDWARTWQVWIRNTKPEIQLREFKTTAQRREDRQEQAAQRFLQAFSQPTKEITSDIDWNVL